jgi:hypothetical protein
MSRILIIALTAGIITYVYRKLTADKGGSFDPDSRA